MVEKINNKLSIIKYGSNTLVKQEEDGQISIDYENIQAHGSIINSIQNPAIIVSSGAIAFGKTFKNDFQYVDDEIVRKRIFSAIGNPHLSILWDKAIPNKRVLQSLLTHRDLSSESSKEKISQIILSLYKMNESVIQINDNDFVTDEELVRMRGGDFGDNDKITALLAKLCSSLFKNVEVVFNTSSDGVLENNKVIPSLNADRLTDQYINDLCGTSKTKLGAGGMHSKLKIIRDTLNETENLEVRVINGKKPEQLKSILSGKNIGTKIYK